MTIEEIAIRLHLSASGARALIDRQGWKPIGHTRKGRAGPERAEYDAVEVEAHAAKEAARLREEAAALDPKEPA